MAERRLEPYEDTCRGTFDNINQNENFFLKENITVVLEDGRYEQVFYTRVNECPYYVEKDNSCTVAPEGKRARCIKRQRWE